MERSGQSCRTAVESLSLSQGGGRGIPKLRDERDASSIGPSQLARLGTSNS